MGFKIQTSKKLNKLVNPNARDGLISKTRTEFNKRGNVKIKQAIIQDMIRGVSPVAKNRWGKYSDSYKEVIRNKAAYRTLPNGKVIKYSAGRKAKSKAFVRKLNRKFMDDASPTKRISPVNLRHTGKLHRSLSVNSIGGFLRKLTIVIRFKNKLADIHNRQGAGRSKVVRRLLPTKSGEQFNRKINTTIFNQLKKAVDTVAKEFSRQ